MTEMEKARKAFEEWEENDEWTDEEIKFAGDIVGDEGAYSDRFHEAASFYAGYQAALKEVT